MVQIPSLFSLCIRTISLDIIQGHACLEDIHHLPASIFDDLILSLPALALQKIQEQLVQVSHECGQGASDQTVFDSGNKRKRHEDFINTAWMRLFEGRWSDCKRIIKPVGYGAQDEDSECNLMNQESNWQQLYWQQHLQDCLDEAAEIALLPHFGRGIINLKIPDKIMDIIGYGGDGTYVFKTLLDHINKFKCYLKYLKLQNVLCNAEIRKLLEGCDLQGLVFRRIVSQSQVDAVCQLLEQHTLTLMSIEFVHCSYAVDQILGRVFWTSTPPKLKQFCVKSSNLFANGPTLMPSGLLRILSSERSLESSCFSDTKMSPNKAAWLLEVLLQDSSNIVTLEISENNISGWLSKVGVKSLSSTSLLGSEMSLKSLAILNLSGNNLRKQDAADLNYIFAHTPSLRSLDISNNPITDAGLRCLIPYFVMAVQRTCPLLDIKIRNCDLSCFGVSEFLSNLPKLKEPLNTLSIAENELGSSIVAPLAKFLDGSGVRELNIEDIGLGVSGLQQLEEQMTETATLSVINISKNRGGIRTAYFISKAILQAPHLVSINAGGNVMPSESLQVIYNGLKQSHSKLELLDL